MRKFALALLLCGSAVPAIAQDGAKRPNFLVIVADDLGYSDIGAFGGEIETPNLDALAARGLKLTNFHTAPTCSPTRSMLLTGLDTHEAGLGNMAELIAPNQVGKPGHEGYLPADAATLAERLAAGGYRTHYSGKWHLGVKPEQAPHSRGFQTSFALLEGGSNYFGLDTRQGSKHRSTYLEDGRPATVPDDFYSSDYFATKLIGQLQAAKKGRDAGKPFFAYLAFTAPHWPLQAPSDSIAKYKGKYDAGYEVQRRQRLKRQVELGLLDPKVVPHEFELAQPWASLSAEEKTFASRRMEIFAAMVDRMDWNIGRVVQTLKDTGEYENTVILFLSDNGGEGSVPMNGASAGSRSNAAAADNSFDNLGAGTSYDSIGPGWAEASTAPFWRVKVFQSEGGTRVVSFLSGPGIKPGVGTAYTHVMDVVPTLLDLGGVKRSAAQVAGRAAKPIRGESWAPWLAGRTPRVYPADKPVGAELFGGRSLRKGDWKLLDLGNGQWRLFNLAQDPGEIHDLSAAEPARKAELLKDWEAYAGEVGVVLPSPPQRQVNNLDRFTRNPPTPLEPAR